MTGRARWAWAGLAAWAAGGLMLGGWLVAREPGPVHHAPPPRPAAPEQPTEPPAPVKPQPLKPSSEQYTKLYNDLKAGVYRQGGLMADVLAAYEPDARFDHGPYTTAVYAGGRYVSSLGSLLVVAEGGKLVRAYTTGCLPQPGFFGGRLTNEEDYWVAFVKADKARVEAHMRNLRQQSPALAVAGPVAAIAYPTEW